MDRQGCGNIRIAYPSILLNQYKNKKGYSFEADYLTTFVNDINFYKTFTFVQFQRSATEQHLKLFDHYIKNIKPKVRVPLIYELDDLLQDIPEWNYASAYYNNNNSAIFKMLQLVDGMTVSTDELANVYSRYCENITVIPNHLPKFVWGDVDFSKVNGVMSNHKPRIGWAGSENHFCNRNSNEYKSGIRGGDFGHKVLDFIRKTVDIYQWVFSGACPVELDDVKDKIETYPWVNLFNYPNHLRKLNLDIGLALLMPCSFNNAKSNIKCLEYTAIGVPVVYSNVGPYSKMTLTNNDEYGIIDNIERLVKNMDLRKEVFYKDYEIVKDQLFWEDNENLLKYVGKYLELFGKKLSD